MNQFDDLLLDQKSWSFYDLMGQQKKKFSIGSLFPSDVLLGGGTSPFQVVGEVGQRLNIIFDSIGDTTGQAHVAIWTRRSRGTVLAPSALLSGDPIGGIAAAGYGATQYGRAVTDILAIATENWTDTAQGARISISVCKNGTVVLVEAISVNDDRTITFSNKIFPGDPTGSSQSASGLYAGTGAPNNADGSNGDFYFRSDGGAGTAIYQRRAGAWVGIV